MGSNIIFKLCDLKSLIADEDSRVEISKQCCRNLKILPSQTRNLKQSVKESLDSTVGSYDPELNGIILNFKNIKIQPLTKLVEDGYVPVSYRADIYIFRPKISCVLKGIVNKKSDDHIGCLVHKVFNVVIPRPTNTSYSNWTGSQLNIGDEVVFKVADLNFSSPLPYIRGNLMDSDSQTICDLTDSGIEGNDYSVENLNPEFNPNEISKLINPNDYSDEEINENKAASMSQVSVVIEKSSSDNHSKNKTEDSSLSSDSEKAYQEKGKSLRAHENKHDSGLQSKQFKDNHDSSSQDNCENKFIGLKLKRSERLRVQNTKTLTKTKEMAVEKLPIKKTKSKETINNGVKDSGKIKNIDFKQIMVNSNLSSEDEIDKKFVVNSKITLRKQEKHKKQDTETEKQNSKSLEDDNFQEDTLKTIKRKRHKNQNIEILKQFVRTSSSSERENGKLLKAKNHNQHNTNTQNSVERLSSSEEENFQEGKLLKNKSPVKHNTEPQKQLVENSSSFSEDEILKENKLLKNKTSLKHNTEHQKKSVEITSSLEDEKDQENTLLKIKTLVKPSIKVQNKSVEISSCSSEDETIEENKLLKTKTLVKHSTEPQNKSVEISNSSEEDENVEGNKLKTKTPVKHSTEPQKKSVEITSSSSKDEKSQENKLSKIKTPVKPSTKVQNKSVVISSSSSEDETIEENKLLKTKTPVKHSTEPQKKSVDIISSSSKDEKSQENKLLKIKTPVKPSTKVQNKSVEISSSSSEDEKVEESKLLKTKTPVKHSTEPQKKSVDIISSSSKDEKSQENKLSKIKTPVKPSTKVQNKFVEISSSSSEDEKVEESKLLKTKTPVKHSTEPQKKSVDIISSSSEDEKDQENKLLKFKTPMRHSTKLQNKSVEISSSSSEDEDIQENKLFKKLKGKKHKNLNIETQNQFVGRSNLSKQEVIKLLMKNKFKNHTKLNTKIRNPSLEQSSSSSEDENIQENKLLKKNKDEKFKKLNIETEKQSVGKLSSLEDENIKKDRLLKKDKAKKHNTEIEEKSPENQNIKEDVFLKTKSLVKHNTVPQKQSIGNTSSSSEGESNLEDKILKKDNIEKQKENTESVKQSVGSSSSSEDDEYGKCLKKDEVEKHKNQNTKIKKHFLKKLKLISFSEIKNIEQDPLLKMNKRRVSFKDINTTLFENEYKEKLYNSWINKNSPHKEHNKSKSKIGDITGMEKLQEKERDEGSIQKNKFSNKLSSFKPLKTNSETDRDLISTQKKTKNKKHKWQKEETTIPNRQAFDQSVTFEIDELKIEKKKKKHKKDEDLSNMLHRKDVIDINNEGSKSMAVGDVALLNLPDLRTPNIIDQLNLNNEDNQLKIKKKKKRDKVSKTTFEEIGNVTKYIESPKIEKSPLNIHKENDILSILKMEKDKKTKKDKKKDKFVQLSKLDNHVNNFDIVTNNLEIQVKEKPEFNSELENVTKIKKKKHKNKDIIKHVEKEVSQNKSKGGTTDLISLLLAKAATDINKNSSHIKKQKSKRKLTDEEKKERENSKKRKTDKKLVSGDIMSGLLRDAFKSVKSKSDLKEDKLTEFHHGFEKTDLSVGIIKSLSRPNLDKTGDEKVLKKKKKRKISIGSEEMIPKSDLEIKIPSKKKKKRKDKEKHSLDYRASAMLSKALAETNTTLVNINVPKVTEMVENTLGSEKIKSLFSKKKEKHKSERINKSLLDTFEEVSTNIKCDSSKHLTLLPEKISKLEEKNKELSTKKSYLGVLNESSDSDSLLNVKNLNEISNKFDVLEYEPKLKLSKTKKNNLSKKSKLNNDITQSKPIFSDLMSDSSDSDLFISTTKMSNLTPKSKSNKTNILSSSIVSEKLNHTKDKLSLMPSEEKSKVKTTTLKMASEVSDTESIPCYQNPVEEETIRVVRKKRENMVPTKHLYISMPNTEDRQRKLPPNKKSVGFKNYVSSVFS